jgi:hypothetical protein
VRPVKDGYLVTVYRKLENQLFEKRKAALLHERLSFELRLCVFSSSYTL